jgi:putative transcriptional regulator
VESLQGKLLIASPALADPNFSRAVVLVAHHDEEGAMGLVLSRPSPATVGEVVPELLELANGDETVYVGGPVQPSAVIALAEFDEPDEPDAGIFGNVGFVTEDSDPDDLVGATKRVRVFAGYAGWGPGQLEAELDEPSWIVEPAREEDVFADDPSDLWREVLRRKGGQFALIARMPDDPSVN